MDFLTLRGGEKLAYEAAGDGPPLLLVSGLGGVASYWAPLVPRFAERFRVVLHDHRGTGQSSHSPIDYSIEQMADDLLQLMDALGIERAHLIGHSTGGAIGQTLGLDRPERIDRLVLSATWTAADAYFRRLFEVRARILRDSGPEAYVRSHALFMNAPWFFRDHAEEIEAGEGPAVAQFAPAEVMLSRIDAILRFDRRAELGRLTAPTLVSCARDDIVTPAYYSEELGQLIPGARVEIAETGGHFYPRAFADDFADLAIGFLEG